MTEFLPTQKKAKTGEYIQKFLAKRYSSEVVYDTTAKYEKAIIQILMEEYGVRRETGSLLRYQFLDADGERVAGIGNTWNKQHRIFQDAINKLTDSEFETLSAKILLLLGCRESWVTPQSHDQGLDAFGYASAFPAGVPIQISDQCRIVCLAQAKHYRKHKVGSSEIREFVGARELAIHKIFSTEDQRYADLEIRPFGPSMMVFITTEELPRTVKLMGKNSGIIVLSAQDLAVIFLKARIVRVGNWSQSAIVRALKTSIRGIPTAQ